MNPADHVVACPACGSSQITAQKKGFGLGKAAAGGLLLGPVGLLGGMLGSGTIRITCLSCGYEWVPGIPAPRSRSKPAAGNGLGWAVAVTLLSFVMLAGAIKWRTPGPARRSPVSRSRATTAKREPSRSFATSPSPAEIESAISLSDDFDQYKQAFIKASIALVEKHTCTLADLRENGGWVRSQAQADRPVYFTYCGGPNISSRIYLNVSSGEVFR